MAAFHYDCYWMREFHWCDFEWDKRFFGDIESTLKRLHEDKGYLVRKPNGEVWQTDFWQAGMGWWTSPTLPPMNGSRTRSRSPAESGCRRDQDRFRRAHPTRRRLV